MKKRVLQTMLALLCYSQIANAHAEIDRGRFSDGVYQNHQIGISLPVSESWRITDEDDRKMFEGLFLGHQTTHHHLLFSLYNFETIGDVPAGVHLFASKLSSLSGISNSTDYLQKITKIFTADDGRNRAEVGSVRSGAFGGQEFKAISFSVVGSNQFTWNQYIYATVRGEYAVSFLVTYGETTADFNLARRLLQGIQFEK